MAGKGKARSRWATRVHEDEMHFGFVLAEHAHVFDVGVGALVGREPLPNQLQRGPQVRTALDELHALVVGGVAADRRLEDPLDLLLGCAGIGTSRRRATGS